jgi:Fe-S-cluster containining protein
MMPLKEAVEAAAGRAEVREAVARVYADLEREIDVRKPICTASGRCCRFEEFGHRLYVTTAELAAFVYGVGATGAREGWDGTGCPYQVDGLCSVHPIRPFGCRVFFCDATSTDWQNRQYERLHAELKRVHETLSIPYFYVEWREALRGLGIETVLSTTKGRLSLPQLRL